MTPVTRTLSALAWVSMSVLYVLAWHGDVQRGTGIRDGSVTTLWVLAIALNLWLYVTTRQRRMPPLIILWFFSMVVVCTGCLAMTMLEVRSPSLLAELATLTTCLFASAVLMTPTFVARRAASPLVTLIPAPSRRVVGAFAVNLFLAAWVDLAVLGAGVLLEGAAALAFIVTALEQQGLRLDAVVGRLEGPGGERDAHEMAR